VALRPRAVLTREEQQNVAEVGRAVGNHPPEQNKEAFVRSRVSTGQAKNFSGAAHAFVPRTHAFMTTGGVPTVLCERSQRISLHPKAPLSNGPACGPKHSCAGHLDKVIQAGQQKEAMLKESSTSTKRIRRLQMS